MSIKINHELPVPEVLKNEYPLSNEQKSIKQQRDEEIRRIFTGESDKFVVLVGPCSADNESSLAGSSFQGDGRRPVSRPAGLFFCVAGGQAKISAFFSSICSEAVGSRSSDYCR